MKLKPVGLLFCEIERGTDRERGYRKRKREGERERV